MLVSVVLMTVDHRQHHLNQVRSALSVVVYPLQYLVNFPVAAGDWVRENLATRRRLEEENASLRTQRLLLKAQLQKLSALEAENIRLRELLQSSFKVGERVLIAEILSVDLDPYKHEILLNKGTLEHVYQGQPLLDADGIMGQVVQVGPLTATAMLITDPNSAIPVQVNRNGLRSIAFGTGAIDRLELPHLPNNADIRKGDLLVTSGLGRHFPPGYPVAVVTYIEQDPGQPFAQVSALPLAHLNQSREVLLVWPADHRPPAKEHRQYRRQGQCPRLPATPGDRLEMTPLVRHHGGGIIVLTFLAAMVLAIVPLPDWAHQWGHFEAVARCRREAWALSLSPVLTVSLAGGRWSAGHTSRTSRLWLRWARGRALTWANG